MVTPLVLALASFLPPQSGPNPPEFGAVRWGRKLEPALEAARRDGKPVLLLFQEVPG